jgi:hypothetical protein
MVMTATVLSGASERVWEVAGVLLRACARGDVKGRSAVTRSDDALDALWRAHVDVLARSGRHGHVLSWPMPRSPGPGRAQHAQWSVCCLFDQVRVKGEGRGESWQG